MKWTDGQAISQLGGACRGGRWGARREGLSSCSPGVGTLAGHGSTQHISVQPIPQRNEIGGPFSHCSLCFSVSILP